MADGNPEINKRTNAYRLQQRLATDAAAREIADKERQDRERKTALLRERRGYVEISRVRQSGSVLGLPRSQNFGRLWHSPNAS